MNEHGHKGLDVQSRVFASNIHAQFSIPNISLANGSALWPFTSLRMVTL